MNAGEQSRPAKKKRASRASTFHVVTVVWGKAYLDLFLDVCVPNQCTAGNLGALPPGSRYRLLTTPAGADVLAQSPALLRLRAFVPVDIVSLPELALPTVSPLARMTAAHCRALADANEPGAALIFLNADHFLSEGALSAVVRLHRTGMRVIATPGIRLDRDAFVGALNAGGAVRSLSSRHLVALALEHLHPFTLAHMADAPSAASAPISVYWRLPAGMLVRSFHLHPLMVDPVRRDIVPKGTIDGDYVARCCPDHDEIHVVADSDELTLFELTEREGATTDRRRGGISLWRAAAMMSRCDDLQAAYWRRPTRIHGEDIGRGWEIVERRAARFAACVSASRRFGAWLLRCPAASSVCGSERRNSRSGSGLAPSRLAASA